MLPLLPGGNSFASNGNNIFVLFVGVYTIKLSYSGQHRLWGGIIACLSMNKHNHYISLQRLNTKPSVFLSKKKDVVIDNYNINGKIERT